MSRRLTEDDSVWMYEDEDREDDEFTDEDLQNGLAQLITGDWGYGSEIRWENIRVETYEQAGVMTYNKGLVLTLPDGTEYQLTIVQSADTALENTEGGKHRVRNRLEGNHRQGAHRVQA